MIIIKLIYYLLLLLLLLILLLFIYFSQPVLCGNCDYTVTVSQNPTLVNFLARLKLGGVPAATIAELLAVRTLRIPDDHSGFVDVKCDAMACIPGHVHPLTVSVNKRVICDLCNGEKLNQSFACRQVYQLRGPTNTRSATLTSA